MLGSKVSSLAFLDVFLSLRFDLETLLALGFQSLVLHSLGYKVRVRVIHPEQIFRGDVGIDPNFSSVSIYGPPE
tara:strand:- start:1735 stop:1956 length:222 start_codon:yes stop_codon:yes gene_type:complete